MLFKNPDKKNDAIEHAPMSEDIDVVPASYTYRELAAVISPASADITPMGSAYDPVTNGCRVPMPKERLESADWDFDHIHYSTQVFPDHLIFEHFDLPTNPNTEIDGQDGAGGIPGIDPVWMDAYRQGCEYVGLVNVLKRHRQHVKRSQAVVAFLTAYPAIPEKTAYLVRGTYLGANIPLKHGPSCVWEQSIDLGCGPKDRLFRQPLAKGGIPMGAAQSWVISDWNRL